MKCILCDSKNLEQIDRIKMGDIISLYKKAFGIDVGNLIKSDLIYRHCPNCDLRFFTDESGSIPTGDNDFYNALNQLDWYYFSEKNEYKQASAYIKELCGEEASVLEVGCGKAAFVKYLSPKSRKKYVGLEFSTQAKKMAAKEGISIQNISVEDYAKTISKTGAEFDVACSFQVLEHVSNPREFLQGKIACLKNGGGGATSRQKLS